MKQKVKIALFSALCLILTGFSAGSALAFELSNTDRESGNASLSTGTTVSDNYFSFGNNVAIDGQVMGDLFTAGNQINVSGNVNNNIFVAGNTIVIKGDVERDVFAAGANIIIEKGSIIKGDLSAAAGTLTIDGEVKGMVRAGVGTINVNGKVGKGINSNVETFNINQGAVVDGDIVYTSSKQANISKEAQISGKIELKDIPTKTEKNAFREKALSALISLLSALLIGVILVSLLPKKLEELTNIIKTKFWASFGTGFLIFFAVPMAALILLMILIGIPLAMILTAVYIIMIYLSKIIFGLVIGKLITKDAWAPIWSMTAGILIYSIVTMIPIIGGLAMFVAILLSFGAVGLVIAGKK